MAYIHSYHAQQNQLITYQNKEGVCLEKLARRGSHNTTKPLVWDSRCQKCSFPHNVSTQWHILSGMVTRVKMQRTIVICQDYLHYIQKYNCFEKSPRTCLCTCPPVSGMSILKTLSQWVSASPWEKLWASTHSRSPRLLASKSSSRSSEIRHLPTPQNKTKLFSP